MADMEMFPSDFKVTILTITIRFFTDCSSICDWISLSKIYNLQSTI